MQRLSRIPSPVIQGNKQALEVTYPEQIVPGIHNVHGADKQGFSEAGGLVYRNLVVDLIRTLGSWHSSRQRQQLPLSGQDGYHY